MGDEKEIPLLHTMINSDEAIIRKKAKSGLKKLMKRLASEHGQEIANESLESKPEQSDIFEIDFKLNRFKPSGKMKLSSNRNDTNGNTLFDHLCSMSTKLYDKFSG